MISVIIMIAHEIKLCKDGKEGHEGGKGGDSVTGYVVWMAPCVPWIVEFGILENMRWKNNRRN